MERRSSQTEYFDAARPEAELAEFFHTLNQINRLFVFAEPFQRSLPQLLGTDVCRTASILDLGAGDGFLGRVLSEWARERGWHWRVTNLDLSLSSLRLDSAGRNVAGSALALPFRTGSFDAVIASQMTHHLTDAETRQHLAEAWRVARHVIMLSDLHRNAALYGVLWLLFHLKRTPATIAADGLLSVRRGWRVAELRRLVVAAGVERAKISLYFGARILLQARRQPS